MNTSDFVRIGVAINPSSGRGRGSSYGEQTRDVLSRYPVDIVELSGASAAESLHKARQAVSEGAIDALLTVGGDGMVHVGANAVADTHVPLGIIAVGSGNDIAREFRLPIRNVYNSVHQVISCLFGGRARPTDVIAIDSAVGRSYALAVLSAGIDAAINLRTNNLTWPKGNMRYVRAALESLSAFPTYGMRIRVDGMEARGPITLAAIANTRYIGGGMNIAPQAKTDDGILNVMVGYAPHAVTLLRLLPLLYSGKYASSRIIHTIAGRHIHIEEDPAFGSPAPIAMADGEIIDKLPLDITCLPGGLDLLI